MTNKQKSGGGSKILAAILSTLRRYFISGLLVWIPIVVTIFVIHFVLNLLDSSLLLLPSRAQPDYLLGYDIPGFGVVITLVVIFATGFLAANFFGKRLVKLWDKLINRIPLVRSLHSGVKQMMETLLSSSGHSFRKVVLVEYPASGLWSIAFQTGAGTPEIQHCLGGDEIVTVFIPTTPNPTSGFLMYAKKKDVIELKMPVDQALKFVISLGVVQPIAKNTSAKIQPIRTDL